jgi:hypothetical protein
MEASTKPSTRFENESVTGLRCAGLNRALLLAAPTDDDRSVEGETWRSCAARESGYAGISSGRSPPWMSFVAASRVMFG